MNSRESAFRQEDWYIYLIRCAAWTLPIWYPIISMYVLNKLWHWPLGRSLSLLAALKLQVAVFGQTAAVAAYGGSAATKCCNLTMDPRCRTFGTVWVWAYPLLNEHWHGHCHKGCERGLSIMFASLFLSLGRFGNNCRSWLLGPHVGVKQDLSSLQARFASFI